MAQACHKPGVPHQRLMQLFDDTGNILR